MINLDCRANSSGNTCRSPIAECVFRHLIQEQGMREKWEVDSAAIMPWHVGRYPNPKAFTILKKHNVSYSECTPARQECSV